MHALSVHHVAAKEDVLGSEICTFFAENSFYNCHLNILGTDCSSFTYLENTSILWSCCF